MWIIKFKIKKRIKRLKMLIIKMMMLIKFSLVISKNYKLLKQKLQIWKIKRCKMKIRNRKKKRKMKIVHNNDFAQFLI